MAKTKSPRRSGRRAKPGRRKVSCWLDADLVASIKAIAAYRDCEIGEIVGPACRAYLGKRSYVVDGEPQLGIVGVAEGQVLRA
jgi:hypothetical protein